MKQRVSNSSRFRPDALYFLILAGWYEGRSEGDSLIESTYGDQVVKPAKEVLREFGHLRIAFIDQQMTTVSQEIIVGVALDAWDILSLNLAYPLKSEGDRDLVEGSDEAVEEYVRDNNLGACDLLEKQFNQNCTVIGTMQDLWTQAGREYVVMLENGEIVLSSSFGTQIVADSFDEFLNEWINPKRKKYRFPKVEI